MNKADAQRQINWRVKIIKHASEETLNVARRCRHFGISRKIFYKWIKRHESLGDAGLCDQARTPHKSPKETPSEVVSKILHARTNQSVFACRNGY